jgi:hypothetical protein
MRHRVRIFLVLILVSTSYAISFRRLSEGHFRQQVTKCRFCRDDPPAKVDQEQQTATDKVKDILQ